MSTVEIQHILGSEPARFKVIVHGTFTYEKAQDVAAKIPLAVHERSVLPGPPHSTPVGKTRGTKGEQLYRCTLCGGSATSDVIARRECCSDRR